MFVGVDGGGTKIEAVALTCTGEERARVRVATPRSDDAARHAQIDLAAPVAASPPTILQRVRDGDRLARLVWQRCLDRLARSLAVVVDTPDPDVIVLGGGMSNIPELYDELPARVASDLSPCCSTPVVAARHGDPSGGRGAAWLWR